MRLYDYYKSDDGQVWVKSNGGNWGLVRRGWFENESGMLERPTDVNREIHLTPITEEQARKIL